MESNSLRMSPQEELRIISNSKMKPQPKAKASFKHNNTRGDQEQEENIGFLWLSSGAYTCSFCKRQFRSAQALGGHMNVHRRDRAKLRRRSPPLDSTHHGHDFHGSSSQPIKFLKLYDFSSFNNGGEEESDGGCKIWKKVKKFVNKETGLLSGSNEIDLELRLGF